MANSTYLYLKPVEWSQKIVRYPDQVEGSQLRLSCITLPNSDLLLSDGYKLSDLKIELGILQRELRPEDRADLPEKAIGGIWWLSDFWDQVRDGGYVTCGIDLGIRPVRHTESSGVAWSGNPVSIESADIHFHRAPISLSARDPSQEKAFNWARLWAVMLFINAAFIWSFPKWNGVFSESLKDVTTGEGRIVAAVLLVGGLLLWFLRSPMRSEFGKKKESPGLKSWRRKR
jgi:hypothetical protein